MYVCQHSAPVEANLRSDLFISQTERPLPVGRDAPQPGYEPSEDHCEVALSRLPNTANSQRPSNFRRSPRQHLRCKPGKRPLTPTLCSAGSFHHGSDTLGAQRCQRLFHSLSKVLFIFRSHYLFTIGLGAIFSLRRSTPAVSTALSNCTTLGSHSQ